MEDTDQYFVSPKKKKLNKLANLNPTLYFCYLTIYIYCIEILFISYKIKKK